VIARYRLSLPQRRQQDSVLRRLVEWMDRREEIRLRRLRGEEPPWTSDPILRMYRFTNVCRRDDRVSLWIRQNITARVGSTPCLPDFQMIALGRWINWPPTLREVIDKGLWPSSHLDLVAVGRLIDRRVSQDEKAWTGAYMIRSEPTHRGGKGKFIAERVVGRGLTRIWPEMIFALQTRMRRPVWRVLIDGYNWGSFMAGQVVDDLTWTPLLDHPRDDLTWAPQGPGSLRGLNRLLGLPLRTMHSELFWCQKLQEIYWSEPVQAWHLHHSPLRLSLMDLQSVLCEWDKYERVRLGEGRPRSLYRPETAF
jgi:hypothetical protein